MDEKEKTARQILGKLHQAGHEAYFAGGCVRDRLSGKVPHDFDIAGSARPEEVAALFEKTIPVGAQFGVMLVVESGHTFEVATFRQEGGYQDGRRPTEVSFTGVKEDACRRDFTVNGLYFDVQKNQVLDFVGGEADIQKKIIRSIGNPDDRFQEDHLRLMRAVRFSVQLGFEIEEKTWAAVKKHAASLSKVSVERIRDELAKILTSAEPARGIRLLDEAGLLKVFLPEMEVMKGVEQPSEYHPEGDVFIHTLMLLDGLNPHPEFELALGCLLHDVAKPATFERAADRIRFHGHDVLGAKMSREICQRLAISNDQTDLICELVEHHLRFKDSFQMRIATLKRFMSLPRFDLHLELHRVDCMASHGKLDAHKFMTGKYEEFLKLPPPPLRLVTGEDLKALGLSPSPLFGEILKNVEDAILEGKVTTKEEGVAWAKAWLKEQDGK